MKQHLSVFGLFARSSLARIGAILLLMGGVEVLFFEKELASALTAYRADVGGGFPQLERLIDRSAANVWFALAFAVITVLLCLPGCEFRARSGYTLRRLSIGEVHVFLWQFAYNTFIYLLLGAVQTAVAYGLCLRYATAAPAEVLSGQTLFLAFYRSEFLHALLPLGDVALWIRNFLLALSLGVASAMFPCKQRAGKYSGAVIAMASYAVVFFERGIGEFSHLALTACAALMVFCEPVAFWLAREREEVEEHEAQ